MSLVDLLILTPLDEEWRSSIEVLASNSHEVQCDAITYYLWHLPYENESKLPTFLIVGASMGTMGIGNTGVFSSEALREWDPSYVVLLGIAGSLNQRAHKLGDVIVSEEVFGYEVAVVKGQQQRFSFRITGHQTAALLFDRARALRNSKDAYMQWQETCVEAAKKLELPLERFPMLHFGITASGNEVVQSKAFGEMLKNRINTKIEAVEMEAKGLFQAVHMAGDTTHPLMIRGISDFADSKKRKLDKSTKGKWRIFAAGNAARCLAAILSREPFAPIFPRLGLLLNIDPTPKALLDNHKFIESPGASNIVFSDIFGKPPASAEIRLKLVVHGQKNEPFMPDVSLCRKETKKAIGIVGPQSMSNAGIVFIFPRIKEQQSISLLLASVCPISQVLVEAQDEFGRKAAGKWPA